MTARQQLARVLPLLLLVVLVLAGVRGTVPAPRWNGPLKADGVAIGIAVEVLFAVLLVSTLRREAAAARDAAKRPYSAGERDIEPGQALRFVLKWVLGSCLIALPIILITNLHLHFFSKPKAVVRPPTAPTAPPPSVPVTHAGHGSGFSLPLGPILYGLLIAALVAAIAVSIWWSVRARRPARAEIVEDATADELRDAVNEGRAALTAIDDARAAIIACYAAMERSLAANGTARTVADTPDELLARAVNAGLTEGSAASRLTALFYEARYSKHPLTAGQRDAAAAALDELAAELATHKAQQEQAKQAQPARPSAGSRA
jgi:hypothetical protein